MWKKIIKIKSFNLGRVQYNVVQKCKTIFVKRSRSINEKHPNKNANLFYDMKLSYENHWLYFFVS